MNEKRGGHITREGLSPADRVLEGNLMLGAGMAIAALGIGGALITGGVCTICVVIPPLLIGAGIYERMASRRARRSEA